MADQTFEGTCWVFGDDINTDEIIPANYLVTTDARKLGQNCMDGIRPGFSKEVQAGDIMVGGENFGCGSSREHAPLALKGLGMMCVVAKSFARIFFRNAINIGLPIIECPEVVDVVKEGDTLKIDLAGGRIIHPATEKAFEVQPFPDFLRRIIDAGGLMAMVQKQLEEQG